MWNLKQQKMPGCMPHQTSTNIMKKQRPRETRKFCERTSIQVTWCSFVIPTSMASYSPSGTGPFVVANMVKPGVYRLLNEEGVKMSHTWNADNLRHLYP
jgi:hypothetical protein